MAADSAIEGKLPLRKSGAIDFVFYTEYRNDLLLVYEVSDGETGSGTIVRLDSGSLRAKWRLNLPAFNLSVGVIEGTRLYQAGIGFVASIDLERGTYVWKHAGLYDPVRSSFNAFERPEVGTTEVVFRERLASSRTGTARSIRVANGTGKMHVQYVQPGT